MLMMIKALGCDQLQALDWLPAATRQRRMYFGGALRRAGQVQTPPQG